MTDQPRQPCERPFLVGIVDEFVEFVDTIECDLSQWKPRPVSAGPPDQILSIRIDEVIEFTDQAIPPSSLNGTPENKPASQSDPAA